MSKTRSFLALYWVYGVIGASLAGCFATLWLDASSVAVRNGFFWHFALVLPAVLFLYGRQHGQGWLVLAGRVIATLALAPSLLAGTLGLPEWTQRVLTEPVRVALRIVGMAVGVQAQQVVGVGVIVGVGNAVGVDSAPGVGVAGGVST